MSNKIYPPVSDVRLTTWNFSALKGKELPEPDKKNDGHIGNYIDNYLKEQMNIHNPNAPVDLASLGIEVKSKKIDTGSSWSIGTITVNDIINTSYVDSKIYKKLQALLLVTTDIDFRIVKEVELHYFDNDEIQSLLDKSYEKAREEIRKHVLQNVTTAYELGKVSGKVDLTSLSNLSTDGIKWSRFKGKYGYFEYRPKEGNLVFRLTKTQLKNLICISQFLKNENFELL